MNKGRRGFFSGAGKTAVMGGAALLLPRSAMSTLSRSSELREVTEEVYVEESHEISAEQVAALMARVKELETFIANPPWFQGRQGPVGMQGVDGCAGLDGRDGIDHSYEIAELRSMLTNQSVVSGGLDPLVGLHLISGNDLRPDTLEALHESGHTRGIPLGYSTRTINPSQVCNEIDRLWEVVEHLAGGRQDLQPSLPSEYRLIETHYGY